MSLIQRNAVPLVIVLAVIAVGVGVFLSRSPFAFGEEPVGCNVSTVGISILTTDADGNPVTETYHGATLSYAVILSIPELPAGDTACNYGGGTLTVTLPDGEEVVVAGSDETGTIDTVRVGRVYEAPAAQYVVDQGDATNMEITARANYEGGVSLSVPEGEIPPEASARVSGTTRLTPPAISLEMTPETQLVYLGQQANFDITVTNTGGFALSNATVLDRNAVDCDRVFATLAVGAAETYSCALVPGNNIINEATVIAAVVGGVNEEDSQVEATDSADVTVETVLIGIDIEPELQRVRLGNSATFDITVTIPGTTALNNVNVSVPLARECDNSFGSLEAGAVESYNCVSELVQGSHSVIATVSGEVPGLSTLTDSDEAQVEVFALDLVISIDPEEQTIREGSTADFTITVQNFGDTTLTNASITNTTVSECNNSFASLAPGAEESYDCTSAALSDDLTTTAVINATAPDGGGVSAEDSADVIILRPSTAIGVTETDTMVLRLVVQTLTVTETNDGDSPLTDVYVELEPTGVVLTKESSEYVRGDLNEDSILDVGETWEWRVVTVAVAGNYVALSEDALNMEFVAIGHGIDQLGGDVTFPGDAEERGTLEVPIVTR